jgi:hypothetical protein
MPSRTFVIFFLLLISFFAFDVKGQSKYQKVLEVSYEGGPLISNGKEWADELHNVINYQGVDVRIGWRNFAKNHYTFLYRYPVFGIGYSVTLPYYSEIGRPQAVYAFGEFPLTHKGLVRKFNLSYYGQIGLGFNLNPYDPDKNPDNQFIGSEMNAYIHLGFKANYKITPKLMAFTMVGLKHYSNGATKKPNAGINLIPISIGFRTNLGKQDFEFEKGMELPPLEKRWVWNFALYAGMKNYRIGDPTYFRGGFGVNYLWEAGYKYRLGLGLDVFFAPGMKSRFPDQEFDFSDQVSVAMVGSWEWKLNKRLYVPIGFGAYLKRNEKNEEISWFYERVGVRYRFDSNVFAGLQIKAHKAKADFFEFTLGYTLPGKIRYISNR